MQFLRVALLEDSGEAAATAAESVRLARRLWPRPRRRLAVSERDDSACATDGRFGRRFRRLSRRCLGRLRRPFGRLHRGVRGRDTPASCPLSRQHATSAGETPDERIGDSYRPARRGSPAAPRATSRASRDTSWQLIACRSTSDTRSGSFVFEFVLTHPPTPHEGDRHGYTVGDCILTA